MMQKLRPYLLIGICLVLGVLVWLDSAPDDRQIQVRRPSVTENPATASRDAEAPAPNSVGTPNAFETHADSSEGEMGAASLDQSQFAETSGAEENAATEEDGSGAPADESAMNPLASIGFDQLSETLDRPLFAPARKRPPPKEMSAVAPKAQEQSYELLGVALGGGRPVAIMRKKTDGRSFRVEVGDSFGGWQVTKVEPQSVHLERSGGASEIVRLLRQ